MAFLLSPRFLSFFSFFFAVLAPDGRLRRIKVRFVHSPASGGVHLCSLASPFPKSASTFGSPKSGPKRNEKMLFRRLAQKRRKTCCVFLVLLNADGKAVGLVGMEGCGAPHARGLVIIRCELCMRDDFKAACGRLRWECGTWCVGGRGMTRKGWRRKRGVL